MIHKQILVPDRVRRPPTDGWSWIDRRFLREHAPRLSHEAIVLYFFLAAVSDKDGLSFYGDASIGRAPADGRNDRGPCPRRVGGGGPGGLPAPLVQVLSLPAATLQRRGGGLAAFGEILRSLADPSSPAHPQRSS